MKSPLVCIERGKEAKERKRRGSWTLPSQRGQRGPGPWATSPQGQEWKLLNVLYLNKPLSFINKAFKVNAYNSSGPQRIHVMETHGLNYPPYRWRNGGSETFKGLAQDHTAHQ